MGTAAAGIQYAPEDSTLPKPWKGLVDEKTGYLYFWNPETNVTQYEKPVASVPFHKFVSSSVQKSPQAVRRDNNDDDKSKILSGAGTYETARSRSDYSQGHVDVHPSVGNGTYAPKGAENSLSAESYRRQHEISVTGDNVPQPFSSFEATGFPPDILREVRYLLLEELNVVHCATILCGLACIWSTLIGRPICLRGFPNHPSLGGNYVGCNSVCPLVE